MMPTLIQRPRMRMVYAPNQAIAPQQNWFDPQHWPDAREADEGRGSTWFIHTPVGLCVLKHYRRGGLVAKISDRHYLFTGWAHARAMREWYLLAQLKQDTSLPVPDPIAAIVWRSGPLYQCALITRFIEHRCSLTALAKKTLEQHQDIWVETGRVIARLAQAGIAHVDLNPDNVLIDHNDDVHIIDFDRAGHYHHDGRQQVKRLLRGLAKRLALAGDDAAIARVGRWLNTGLEQAHSETSSAQG